MVDLLVSYYPYFYVEKIDENGNSYLASLGFTVLRYENRFVFRDPEYLKTEIIKVLNKRNVSNG